MNFKLFLIGAFASLSALSSFAQSAGAGCMVGYYKMDGNAKDSSGAGNHCTVNGAALTSDRFGHSNSAYYFDGSSSLYTPLDTRAFEGMSVTAWIKTTYTSQQSTIVQIAGPVLYTNRFSKHKFFSSLDGSTQDNSASQESTTDVTEGQWIFVSAVCDGNTTKLYVNDSLENSFSESLYKSDAQMTIGLQANNMWGFTGSIDEVRIYKCALTDNDIKAIYDEESKQPTGINANNNNFKQQNGFSIYPNPSNGHISVKFDIANAKSLQVKDLAGKILQTEPISASSDQRFSLDMSSYKKGVYYIQLNANDKVYNQKVILQ